MVESPSSFECFEHWFIYFRGWMRGRPLHVERLEENWWSCFSLSTVWALGNRLRPLGSGVSPSTCWAISLIHPAALKMKSISMVRSERVTVVGTAWGLSFQARIKTQRAILAGLFAHKLCSSIVWGLCMKPHSIFQCLCDSPMSLADEAPSHSDSHMFA